MPYTTFNPTDFIVSESMSDYHSKMNEFVATSISVPSLDVNKSFMRERQVSVCESEDSFITFQCGTDEEVESTEESDTENDETSSSDGEVEEGEDEVDFVFSAIVSKRVRFAEASDLCHVHNMIQWSFAYHKARRGPWEEYARDRDRFGRRTADVAKILAPVLDPAHRWDVYRERFQGNALAK